LQEGARRVKGASSWWPLAVPSANLQRARAAHPATAAATTVLTMLHSTHRSLALAALLSLGGQERGELRQKEAAVLETELAIGRGYEHNDVATVRRYLTDDYTLTDARGAVTTKQDDIDDFTKHRVRYLVFRNQNMKVRLYPRTAIVTGQTIVKAVSGTTPIEVEVQFTDTLILINGRWMLAAGHVSRLKPAPAA
jgi:ketosteroid isomerase-like protein